jgi:hypothetical protein
MSFCCRHVALISSSLDSSKGFLDPRLALDIDPTTLLLTSTSSPLIQSHTVSSGVLFLGGFLLEGINNPLSKLSDTWTYELQTLSMDVMWTAGILIQVRE